MMKPRLMWIQMLSHKGVAIGNAIESRMLDWGINKVFTMTIDNASSNDTVIAHMKKKLTKKNVFVLDGEFFHIRCCAHILNLIVRDGMEEEEGSIRRIRSAVKYIRGSPQRVERFKNCCELDQIPYKNNLVLDVATRWNYTFLMLETTLKFQKAFERLEEVDPHYLIELEDDVPRDIDRKNAKIFCKFLRTFYEVTKRLSGSLYVTSNYYFHDVMLIQSTIRSWSCSLYDCLRSMAIRMDAKFKRYWGDLNKMNMMLFFAVVLDPCYKLKYVVHCYKKLYDEEATKKLEAKIKEALGRLYTYYVSLDPSSQRSEVGDTSVNNYIEDNQGESMVDDEYVISFESDTMNEEEDTRSSKTELEIYLDEVCIKKVVGTPFDVLEWWKVNFSRFPVLSLMARDVLAIPVTKVASESAFSTSGRILDQFRSSLSPKVAESLICCQDWLRASPLPIELEARMDELTDLESCISEDPDLSSAFTSPLA